MVSGSKWGHDRADQSRPRNRASSSASRASNARRRWAAFTLGSRLHRLTGQGRFLPSLLAGLFHDFAGQANARRHPTIPTGCDDLPGR